MDALREEVRAGLAQVRSVCASIRCSHPVSPAFACAVCGCGWCSSACREEDAADSAHKHRDLCRCVAADATFVLNPEEHPCAQLMRLAELGEPVGPAANILWTHLGFSPGAVLAANEVLGRQPSLWDALGALSSDAITLALCHCAFIGSMNTRFGHLPPHMVRAAAFCREVLLHHRELLLRTSRAHDTVVGRSVLAFALDLMDRKMVDARMEDVLLPMVERSKEGLDESVFRALVNGFCRAIEAPSAAAAFGPRHWTLLGGIVQAHPDSARAFFNAVDDTVIKRMVAAVKADVRLVPLLNATVRAGDALFRRLAAAFLADEDASIAAMAERIEALVALTLIANAFPKAGVLSDDHWFDTCTRLLLALQKRDTPDQIIMMSHGVSVFLAVYDRMVGTDPARCAAAVEPLVHALACRRVAEAPFVVSDATTALAQLLNRALSLTPAEATFPLRTSRLLAAILRAGVAEPYTQLGVRLARLVAKRRPLAQAVLEQLTPFITVTPLIKRLCGILAGEEKTLQHR